MEFLQSLASNVWSVILIVLFFEGSIFVHELGHFLAARRRGVKVERFSIGMGPPIVSWRGRDGVEYWIAWLPLGGYVKLPQLADLRTIEGESTIDVSTLPPLSYSTKVIVFVMGAVFNVLFAFVLASIIWAIGLPTDDNANTTQIGYVVQTMKLPDGTKVVSPAAKAHLQPGDTILTIDGKEVHDWFAVRQALALGSGRTADGRERLVQLKIQRDGQTLDVDVNPVIAGDEKLRQVGIVQAHDLTLGRIPPNGTAAKLGLKPGDRISGVDTKPIYSSLQLDEYIDSHSATSVTLDVQRAGKPVAIAVPPKTSLTDILNGVELPTPVRLVHQNPITQLESIASSAFQFLGGLINPRSDIGISKVSGPIGIVTQYWDVANSEFPFRMTLWFTILINISLAIFNLLPIPVLDGGNILFATIAKLRGRALPTDFINATQSIFAVLLFSMIVYTLFADVRRLLHSAKPEASEPASTAPAKP